MQILLLYDRAMTLRPVIDSDLESMFRWRNQEANRAVMFTTEKFSWSEHLEWWDRVAQDASRRILIYSHNDESCGVVNFFDIAFTEKSGHWGFYLDNEGLKDNGNLLSAWINLEMESVSYAQHQLGLVTLLCETLQSNKQVIAMHKRFKFLESQTYLIDINGYSKTVVEMKLNLN